MTFKPIWHWLLLSMLFVACSYASEHSATFEMDDGDTKMKVTLNADRSAAFSQTTKHSDGTKASFEAVHAHWTQCKNQRTMPISADASGIVYGCIVVEVEGVDERGMVSLGMMFVREGRFLTMYLESGPAYVLTEVKEELK